MLIIDYRSRWGVNHAYMTNSATKQSYDWQELSNIKKNHEEKITMIERNVKSMYTYVRIR